MIRSLVVSAALLGGIGLPSSVVAGTSRVEFRILPPGHDGQVEGVGRARYYYLGEYLKLAEFDHELFVLRKDMEDLQEVEAALKTILAQQGKELATLHNDIHIWKTRSQRIEESWNTCERQLQSCLTGKVWPYWLGVIGSVVGLVGLAVHFLPVG